MEKEKWFILSRGLWAGMIPLVISLLTAYGIDTTDLANELDRVGTAAILLIGSVLALRSRFKPDAAKLKGKPGAMVILLAAWLAVGCQTAVDPDSLKVGYGMSEAYNVSGPEIEVTADGGIKCSSPNPAAYPCKAQYAGGWETWEKIITAFSLPFEAVLRFFGHTLSPAG